MDTLQFFSLSLLFLWDYIDDEYDQITPTLLLQEPRILKHVSDSSHSLEWDDLRGAQKTSLSLVLDTLTDLFSSHQPCQIFNLRLKNHLFVTDY